MGQELTEEEFFASVLGPKRGRDRSDKVAEKVARRILRDIVARDLKPGAKLFPEALMLEWYGVGRASLRESLRILEVYGLIWIKPGPGGGPVVAEVSSIDFARGSTFFYHTIGATLHELIECRTFVEPVMARLAADRLTDEGAETLRRGLAMEQQALDTGEPGDADDFLPREEHREWWPASFHKIIAGMSGNRVMGLFGQSLIDVYVERINVISTADRRGEVHGVHAKIGGAIISGQSQKAERLMRSHLEELSELFAVRFPGLADEIIDWR